MTNRVIAPPVNMAVSIDEARTAARVNGTALDADIEIHVRALTSIAEHITKRAIINRTYKVTLDRFPSSPCGGPGALELPGSPVASVSSVKFIDLAGVEQTLSPQDWILDRESEPGFIVPADTVTWPLTKDRINAVTVLVVCGYGPDHTTTPPGFKGFILAKIKEIYAAPGSPKSDNLERLLDSLTVYS